MESPNHEFRVNTDPSIVSQKTGLTVLPKQIMANGEWRISVPSLEVSVEEARTKLQPFMDAA